MRDRSELPRELCRRSGWCYVVRSSSRLSWPARRPKSSARSFVRGPRHSHRDKSVMRKLWAGTRVSHESLYTQFTNCISLPRPANGSVPIVIGGHSDDAARRAGRMGDGSFQWAPPHGSNSSPKPRPMRFSQRPTPARGQADETTPGSSSGCRPDFASPNSSGSPAVTFTSAPAHRSGVEEVIAHRGKTNRDAEGTPGYYNFEGEFNRWQDGNCNGSFQVRRAWRTCGRIWRSALRSPDRRPVLPVDGDPSTGARGLSSWQRRDRPRCSRDREWRERDARLCQRGRPDLDAYGRVARR